MDKVIVTGGSGFIGQATLTALVEQGLEVHSISRHPVRALPGVVQHRCDLLNQQQRSHLFNSIRATYLLHLAWVAIPRVYWTSPLNLDWLQATIQLAHEFSAAGGRRFVLSGTAAEYDWSGGYCSERTTQIRPSTLYGAAKFSTGRLLEYYTQRLRCSFAVGRLFSVFGPREPAERLVPMVVLNLIAGKDAPCPSGLQTRDFLYVDDMADALAVLLLSDVDGSVNIASGSELTLKELLTAAGRAANGLDRLKFGAMKDTQTDTPRLVADVTRLKQEVRWHAKFSLEEAMIRTVDWWRTTVNTDRPA